MIELKFPDGQARKFDDGVDGPRRRRLDLPLAGEEGACWSSSTASCSTSTARCSTAARSQIVTRDSPEALEVIRHDTAHVLAEAVQELFPGTQVTIGPNVEDGFYYDFARNEPFSLDDLPEIEKRMREIVDRDEKISREVWDRDEAIAHFKRIGEAYKAEIIEDIPGGEPITVYRQGAWKDLCRGPHLPSTRHVGKAFKLTKLAGAYWRGDQRNAQLQRIYGTAWASEADLEAYLKRLEEAEKRDHRKLGAAMDLFHIQEEGKGMVFWHPKGWTLYRTLEDYMRRRIEAAGYVEVKTPQILDRSLWEQSGHWEKFHANMFVCETDEGEVLAVKPMNCPGHVQIFNHGQRSLPRAADPHGRVRAACTATRAPAACTACCACGSMAQDDGHIFCTRGPDRGRDRRAFVELLQAGLRRPGGRAALGEAGAAARPAVRHGRDVGRRRGDAGARRARRRRRGGDAARRRRLLRPQAGVPPAATPSAAPGSAARCSSTM